MFSLLRNIAAIVFSALFLFTAISGQQLPPAQTTLSVRNAHAMAYHKNENRVYLFGGASEKEVLADLWILADNRWQNVKAIASPAKRTFANLVYDEQNDRLILFGGSKVLFGNGPNPHNLLNDTWEYKDKRWQQIATNNVPSPRAEAAMVYDSHRNRIVLFGGYTIADSGYVKLGDTWEFFDNNWHRVAEDGPSARHGVGMVYHPQEKSVILFGGSTIDRQYGADKGETWRWNGQEWDKLEISQPPGVFNGAMVYDPGMRSVIRFGGWDGSNRINETWLLFDKNWRLIPGDFSPDPRNHSIMVYDQKGKRIILFGGHDGKNIFGDTWAYSNQQWALLINNEPRKRVNNGH